MDIDSLALSWGSLEGRLSDLRKLLSATIQANHVNNIPVPHGWTELAFHLGNLAPAINAFQEEFIPKIYMYAGIKGLGIQWDSLEGL